MEKKILFVDDEQVILTTLTAVFRAMGFVPFSTTNGLAAVDMVVHDNIHVCFFDLRMPQIDGIELCRRVKKIQPEAWIYALSAFVDNFSPEEFSDAGFVGRFKKPFNLPQLKDAAERAFDALERQGIME